MRVHVGVHKEERGVSSCRRAGRGEGWISNPQLQCTCRRNSVRNFPDIPADILHWRNNNFLATTKKCNAFIYANTLCASAVLIAELMKMMF